MKNVKNTYVDPETKEVIEILPRAGREEMMEASYEPLVDWWNLSPSKRAKLSWARRKEVLSIWILSEEAYSRSH